MTKYVVKILLHNIALICTDFPCSMIHSNKTMLTAISVYPSILHPVFIHYNSGIFDQLQKISDDFLEKSAILEYQIWKFRYHPQISNTKYLSTRQRFVESR